MVSCVQDFGDLSLCFCWAKNEQKRPSSRSVVFIFRVPIPFRAFPKRSPNVLEKPKEAMHAHALCHSGTACFIVSRMSINRSRPARLTFHNLINGKWRDRIEFLRVHVGQSRFNRCFVMGNFVELAMLLWSKECCRRPQ